MTITVNDKETFTMTRKELDRAQIIRDCIEGQCSQRSAAKRLNLTTRQVRRLIKRYRHEGAPGLVSRRRGKVSNNRISDAVRRAAIALIYERYDDFKPTLAHEKLTEEHGFCFSVETLRGWMIEEGLWQGKTRKAARIHQSRARRSCYGELIQIDGSPHHWFEDRADPCTLLVFIDDATSQIMALRFVEAETTQAYMDVLHEYLHHYGLPAALYSDRHSIFRNNHQGCEDTPTQFTRALNDLNIEAIHAHSPQAKGRVERANKTLQDRLVKEMRLQGISSMEEGNAFLETYRQKHNARFAVAARHDLNAHRPVEHSAEELDIIFSIQQPRKLTNNLTFSFESCEYQLKGYGKGYRLRGKRITVCKHFDGRVTLLHEGTTLNYKCFEKGEKAPRIADSKTLNSKPHTSKKKPHKPAANHPWRTTPINPKKAAFSTG